MKKLYTYITLLSVIMIALIGCGDYTDFSKLHNLTNEEKAEMARQDSIRLAQLLNINANLILQYSINITTSKTAYDGGTLEIDLDKIATTFGLTKETLLAGIAGNSGAPNVKGFAIEGSSHDDNGTATTTNSTWGHWWDKNGDVTSWGETAYLFAEFDSEAGNFYIGQYPGKLTGGQSIKIIECLKYNEKRVAVVITVNAVDAGAITAPIVNTQELALDVLPRSTYDLDSVQFNTTQVKTDLGVSSLADVKFLAVNADGSYAQELTAPPTGFWYDMDGFAGSWGDNASVFTSYGDLSENKIGIGQYPGHLKAGKTLTIKYAMMANNKIEMFKINITVKAYQDPETAPTGDPQNVEKTIELTKTYSNDYSTVKVDIKDLLRNAFKKTTYQIHQAIVSGELKLYQGAISSTDPTYTADAPGYWLKTDGTAAGWSESVAFCSIAHSETELYLVGGNHPDNGTAGTTVTTKLIATYNGGSVTFNVTLKVQ